MFDVRVVAFAGGSARTLQALQELFGLDRDAAQRLVDNVPMVVRRAAPANEAQNYVEVLRGIGAEVALERPEPPRSAGDRWSADGSRPGASLPDGAPAAAQQAANKPPPPPGARKPPPAPNKVPPPPPKAAPVQVKVAPPPPRDAEPLPRPILRQHTADLEFDLATPNAGSGEPVSAREAEPQSAVKPIKGGAGKRRNEIEFSDDDAGKLELDVSPTRVAPKIEDKPETAEPSDPAKPLATARGDHQISRGESPEPPMSRAAVVHKPGIADKAPYSQRRQLSLLRMLGAILVAAAGIWLDSSIIYGNANSISVIAHGLAIYQFGVGLRGMFP